MRLSVALIPPVSALEQLERIVFEAVSSEVHQLDLVPADRMQVPLCGLGNVTRQDARSISAALRRAGQDWGTIQLALTGAVALEEPGDMTVSATLAGEVDKLAAIASEIPQLVARHGLIVDRRQFRPWLTVGQVTATTTLPLLTNLVETLETYAGPAWTSSELSLLRIAWAGADETGRFEVFETIPLNGSP